MSDTDPVPVAPPAHWTCDVVLSDGRTIHVRPITPEDGPALERFHATLSQESVRFRYFALKPVLSPRELHHLTHVDNASRVAMVAELGDELVAVARYEGGDLRDHTAEVAFLVADEHQGRGVGTVLLEHLASAAREHGITRFTAEVMGGNRRMLAVFRNAGFEQTAVHDSDGVSVEMLIDPTDKARAASEAREHIAEAASVARLLTPDSVAVIGASRNPETAGHQVLKNILAAGFAGQVHAVNPAADEVAGVTSYPDIAAIPGPVDLAIIAVPAGAVLDVVAQCADAGVTSLVVVSAGFSETGDHTGQAALRDLARRNGMRLVGPNCIGVVNTAVGLDATFSSHPPRPGRIAMQSQSGAIGIALLERSSRMGLGVSSFVSVGNKADVSGNDLLQFWENDPITDVILLYLESFGNPRKFSRIARRVSRRKPIVAVKSGRTAAGGRAASSHTAALATPEVAVDALFMQTGVIRVDTIGQLFDMALVLGSQPLPAGNRVAILGNSGGPGILATDASATACLDVPVLSDATQTALRAVIDENGATANPVDLVATASSETYEAALRILLADDDIDAVVVVCTPTFASDPAEIAAMLGRVADDHKPVIGCFLAWPDRPPLVRATERRTTTRTTEGGHVAGTRARGVPIFESPEPAIAALGRAAGYSAWRRRDPGTVVELDDFDGEKARQIVQSFLAGLPDGGWLDPGDVTKMLSAVGIPLPRSVVVGTPAEGSAAAAEIGFPVVVKASGPDIVHKSDVGGIVLDLGSAEEVAEAIVEMAGRLGQDMDGALVQAMVPEGVETIVGVTHDRLFGPLVLFGLGGVATELLQDRAVRILPVTDHDAAEMVRSLRSSPLLFGYRGAPATDTDALEVLLQRIAKLSSVVPEIAELDLNPVIVSPDGVSAVDARIRIEAVTPGPPADLRQMG